MSNKTKRKQKVTAYVWDYTANRNELYDSGGWVLVDGERGISFVAEIHEQDTPNVYKIETTDLTKLRIEYVKKKHFEKNTVSNLLNDVLTSRYLTLTDEIRKELDAYRL